MALVNAPFTCPNSVDSSSSGGSEPLFTATNMWSARGELAWIALATSSFPVPVSPVIRIVDRLDATCPTRSSSRTIRSLLPMMFGKLYRCFSARLRCVFSDSRRRRAIMRSISIISFSLSHGFEK